MIVSDETVSKALQYLSEDPHPIALARKDATDAENKAKEAFAKAVLEADGSVAVKEATATCDDSYKTAKTEEAQAIFELERHKARSRAADMICEIWRTDNANQRAAERVR